MLRMISSVLMLYALQDLSENDITALSNYRLLWMAHIGALGNEIQTMLKSLVGELMFAFFFVFDHESTRMVEVLEKSENTHKKNNQLLLQ